MGKLKKMIRKADRPLQQLAKRFSELENIETNRIYLNNKSVLTNSVHLKNKHTYQRSFDTVRYFQSTYESVQNNYDTR